MFLLKQEIHMNKNGDLQKVIHTTLLTHFSFPRVPCDSKSIYPFVVQKQLMSYIMRECNRQDTAAAAAVEGLLKGRAHLQSKLKTRMDAKIHSEVFNTYALFTLPRGNCQV